MALTSAQVVTLAEMVGETPDAAQSALDALPRIYDAGEVTAIENAIIADLTTFAGRKDKTHLELDGGKDGVRLKYQTSLSELRKRNRGRLGMGLYPEGEYPEGAAYFVVQRGPQY